jgi:hypothetical protein
MRLRHFDRAGLRIGIAGLMIVMTLSPVQGGGPLRNPFQRETSVEKLAKQLDRVERELQYTGRINVKSPDIWGQARLTAHR